jgi:hypothetical protein
MSRTAADVCDFCRNPLYDGNDIYHVAIVGGVTTAYHERCLQIFNGYRAFKSQHDYSCHLEGCQKGPKNPFAETMVKARA